MPVLCKNTDLRCELLVIFLIDMYYLLLSDIDLRCELLVIFLLICITCFYEM